MKVLFIQPPIRDFYRTRFREYPLGLLYLASSLEACGHEAVVFDARLCARPKVVSLPAQLEYLSSFYTRKNNLFVDYKHFGMTYDSITAEVARIDPDAVCISSMFTPYVNEAIDTASAVKNALPQCPVIAGGYHATIDPQSLVDSGVVDCVVQGEGEERLQQVISDLVNSRHPLQTRSKIQNPKFKTQLDSLSFPSRHLIDPDDYRIGKKCYTMILTSRGCPHRCSFCSTHAVAGHEHRTRSIDSVMDEIDECVRRFKIEVFDFQDDNLLFEPHRIKLLLERIIIKHQGRIGCMATNGLNAAGIDREMISLMKRAGFRKLDLALGTGGVPTRALLKRPEAIEQYERVIFWADEFKMPITTYIILGIPTQPIEEMRATIAYLRTKNTLIAPSIFYNVPGMPIFDEMRRYEYLNDHMARRSSAFNCFGDDFTRDDIFTMFKEIRDFNLFLQHGVCQIM